MKIRCANCFDEFEEEALNEENRCPLCGYHAGDPPKEPYILAPGTLLHNRYAIGKTLGVGGFGITYKAWDNKLDIVVTIKEYYQNGICVRVPGTTEVKLYAEKNRRIYEHGLVRFLDEARNMAKFSSEPNIVNIDEFFEENQTAYIVMEFLDGQDLESYALENELPWQRCVSIILDVVSALRSIHKEGIIHRDVAPDNIFICKNGAIKLLDFGAARFSQQEDKKLTIVLKPGYAPPEQYDSVDPQGPWTDVYALGATMYMLLTGEKPEESTNRKINDTVPYPRDLNKSIPVYISNTVMKAMAVEQHMRFQNVDEFEKGLKAEVKVLSVREEKKQRKRIRNITVLAAIFVLAVGLSIFLSNLNKQRKEETLPPSVITLWLSSSGDETVDQAKTTALAGIIKGFTESFPDVTINVTQVPEEEYRLAYRKARNSDTMPNLYESTLLTAADLAGEEDLSFLAGTEEANACYLVSNPDIFKGKGQYRIPLGFVLPVVYVNKILVESVPDTLSALPALSGSQKEASVLALTEGSLPLFEKVWSLSKDDLPAFVEKEEFLSGNAGALLGLTSDYSELQSRLPARYELVQLSGRRYAVLTDYWSYHSTKENENLAAKRFLQYLLSENAQDYLHLRNNSHHLPLNKSALGEYEKVYGEFEGFFGGMDRVRTIEQSGD